ncbi:nucleolar protein 58 [Ricinus communis]|uniref:nucleolar protein 58 n=1 Tax=Ricinus communis TaxID=3988 RepID=UPI00201A8384|nr:nucleolar protein 58 [Ricinus communis]
MKTVTGKIVSSNPVSISKAASILSMFVAAETGASQAVAAYLRRATTAFDELVRLHSKPNRKKHKNQKPDASASVELPIKEVEKTVKDEGEMINEVKEEKSEGERKKKKKERSGEIGKFGKGKMEIRIKEEERSQAASNLLGEEIERKKDRKKNKKKESANIGNCEENGSEIGNNVKIKEEENHFGEDKGKMVINEEKKKRKSREADDQESSDKKKKKKRRKEDN